MMSENEQPPAELPKLVVEFDPATQGYRWSMTGQMPMASLVGMLALVQSVLVDRQKMDIARQAQQQQAGQIVLPGGRR